MKKINFELLNKIKTKYILMKKHKELKRVVSDEQLVLKMMKRLKKVKPDLQEDFIKHHIYRISSICKLELERDIIALTDSNFYENERFNEIKEQLRELETIAFVKNDCELLEKPDFILLMPDYEIDKDRYNHDKIYQGHVDISNGFMNVLSATHSKHIFNEGHELELFIAAHRYFEKLIRAIINGESIKDATRQVENDVLEELLYFNQQKRSL